MNRENDYYRQSFSKFVKIIDRPGEFFRYGGLRRRRLYVLLSHLFRQSVIRERMALSDKGPTCYSDALREDGFCKFEGSTAFDQKLSDVLCQSEKDKAEHIRKDQEFRKQYLQDVRTTRELSLDHPYVRLATDRSIASSIEPYFGFIPILADIAVWYSPNDLASQEGSQLFHLDWAGTSQVKMFVLLDDVDPQCGPTAIIPAKLSAQICKRNKYKFKEPNMRLSDDKVFAEISESDLVQFTGKRGDVYLVDSSRCLHFGSRSGSKPRLVMMVQFLSPFAFRFPRNFEQAARFKTLTTQFSSRELRLLLGHV